MIGKTRTQYFYSSLNNENIGIQELRFQSPCSSVLYSRKENQKRSSFSNVNVLIDTRVSVTCCKTNNPPTGHQRFACDFFRHQIFPFMRLLKLARFDVARKKSLFHWSLLEKVSKTVEIQSSGRETTAGVQERTFSRPFSLLRPSTTCLPGRRPDDFESRVGRTAS